MCQRVRRPAGFRNFPLITMFIYTGEKLNSYRCESCATRKQKEKADKSPTIEYSSLLYRDIPDPQCCRSCGIDFAH